jgi:hypothetical protein
MEVDGEAGSIAALFPTALAGRGLTHRPEWGRRTETLHPTNHADRGHRLPRPRTPPLITFNFGLCAGWPCTPLTALEAMIYSPGRRIWGRVRGDISAGQCRVRIDLEGDGDQRQDKNDDESSHGPVCRGRMRRNRWDKWAKNGTFIWECDFLPPDGSRFARVSGLRPALFFKCSLLS